jgi:hypothetical protein
MNRKTKPRWKSTFLLAAATLLFVCSQAPATPPIVDIPSLNLDLQLILPDTILLNQPFPIVFNVTVRDPVEFSPGDPPMIILDLSQVYRVEFSPDYPAKISINLPWSCTVVEGSPVWKGVLAPGARVSLRITAKFTQPRMDFFQGYVDCSVKGFAKEGVNPILCRTENVTTSRDYVVSGPPPDSIRVDARGRKFIVKDTVDVRPQGTTTCGRHLSKSRQCFENQFAQKYHRR